MELKPEVRQRRVPPTGFWLRLAAFSFVLKLVLVAVVFWLVHTAATAAMQDEARSKAPASTTANPEATSPASTPRRTP